eukprot:jgi/Tetstr1/466003/TSEL_010594.t1
MQHPSAPGDFNGGPMYPAMSPGDFGSGPMYHPMTPGDFGSGPMYHPMAPGGDFGSGPMLTPAMPYGNGLIQPSPYGPMEPVMTPSPYSSPYEYGSVMHPARAPRPSREKARRMPAPSGSNKKQRGPGPAGARPATRAKTPAVPQDKTPKQVLYQLYQRVGLDLALDVQPEVDASGAPLKPPSFTCRMTCPAFTGSELGTFAGGIFTAQAGSKKGCEQAAATKALETLGRSGGGAAAREAARAAQAAARLAEAKEAAAATPSQAAKAKPNAAGGGGSSALTAGKGPALVASPREAGLEQLRTDPELLLQTYVKAAAELRALKAELETERAARLEERETFRKCVAILGGGDAPTQPQGNGHADPRS